MNLFSKNALINVVKSILNCLQCRSNQCVLVSQSLDYLKRISEIQSVHILGRQSMSDPSYINFEILRIGKIITLFHLELVYLNCFYKYVTTTEFLKFMYLHNISLLFSVFRFLQYNELRTIGGFEPRRSTVVSEVDRQSRFKILSNRR